MHPKSFLLCLIASIAFWILFYPGVMSLDSLLMYMDAQSLQFSALRPVFATLILSIALIIGFGIQWVTLLQIALGLFGIRELSIALSKLFGPSNNKMMDIYASILILLLCSPLAPHIIYFATFWTDTWLAIALLWSLAYLIEIHEEGNLGGLGSGKMQKILLIISMLTALVVRSNSILLYPVLVLLLLKATEPLTKIEPAAKVKRYRLWVALTPIFAYGLFFIYQNRNAVEYRPRTEYASYALDLASLIVDSPGICDDLYFTSCVLVQNEFPDEFIVGHGAIDFTLNQEPRYSNGPFFELFTSPQLNREYYYALRHHPFLLLKVKFLNYLDYIGRDPDRFIYPEKNAQTRSGAINFDQPNRAAVEKWYAWTESVIRHPILSWFSFVHMPWLLINIVGLLAALALRRSNKRAGFVVLMLLVPAMYYASFLLVFTASEFRFMFPSMLVVQIFTIDSLLILFSKFFGVRIFVQNAWGSNIHG